MLFHLPHPPSISTDLTFAPNLRVDIKSFHTVYLLFFLNSECLCWLLVQGIDTQLGASSRSAPGARAPELMRLNWSSSPVSSACRHSAPPSGEIPAWSVVGILAITAPLIVLYPRISVQNITSAQIGTKDSPSSRPIGFLDRIQVQTSVKIPIQQKCVYYWSCSLLLNVGQPFPTFVTIHSTQTQHTDSNVGSFQVQG